MEWQEYQEAVGQLYEQMAEFGVVKKNITLKDKVTGQARQIDVWWEMELNGHTFKVLIDAKRRKKKIHVKDVEEILMLAQAVNADKAIIVTNNNWTKPAGKKADFDGLDLRLFTLDQATDIIVEDKWFMCKVCKRDCVTLDLSGYFSIDDMVNWYLAGTCRNCDCLYINCQDCGGKGITTPEHDYKCECPFLWKNNDGILEVYHYHEGIEEHYVNPLQTKLNFNQDN